MKRILFIHSHLCSDSDLLYDCLNLNSRVQGFREGENYQSRHSLMALASRDHKCSSAAAIYMDELLYNKCIQDRTMYDETRNIFLIRDPSSCLGLIMDMGYTETNALNYYLFRLRRMRVMASASRDSVLLTHSDLASGAYSGLVGGYLKLRSGLGKIAVRDVRSSRQVRREDMEVAVRAYEQTHYVMRRLGLRNASENDGVSAAVPAAEEDVLGGE